MRRILAGLVLTLMLTSAAVAGPFEDGVAGLSAACLPGLVLGFFSGWWLRGRVRGSGFRWVAGGIVMGGGAAAILF